MRSGVLSCVMLNEVKEHPKNDAWTMDIQLLNHTVPPPLICDVKIGQNKNFL
jgi:hypothetical protein